ncbi:hypothetical protein BH23ACT9_BH23ACT9_24540 [soil metagenome]
MIGAGDGVRRVELLVRYREDDGSLAAPGAFLEVAEQTGLIGGIDRWMIRQAAGLILSAREPLQVAVNVSAQTFVDPALPRFIDTVFGRGIPDGVLLIEVTETAALADAEAVAAIADALHLRGCRVALDDFGSGFATFAHLGFLRFDVLKVDGTTLAVLAEWVWTTPRATCSAVLARRRRCSGRAGRRSLSHAVRLRVPGNFVTLTRRGT